MTSATWRPSRVFIHYPAGASSGGPEALHQLCDALRGVGVDAALVPLKWPDAGQDTSAFDRYHCPVRDTVPDEPDVAVVVPDVALSYVSRFQHARPVVWWLSIDFSELYGPRMARARREISWGGSAVRLYRTMAPWHPERRGSRLRDLLWQASHCAQSDYAKRYLAAHEGVDAALLSDYVHLDGRFHYQDEGGSPVVRVARSVAYNPAKGLRYVQAMQSLSSDIVWRPITGLNRDQVGELLSTSEAYLDLGHHPGKDRIPREAALAGCVVLVGDRGAAALASDVPVDDALRLPVGEDPLPAARHALEVLRAVLDAPEAWRAGQAGYRTWIHGEEQRFRDEVRAIFVEGTMAHPLGSPGRR